MDYAIFYDDGTIFEGCIDDLPPARGVQVIVQLAKNESPYLAMQGDFYLRVDKPGMIFQAMDHAGLWDWLVENDRIRTGLTNHMIKTNGIWESADIFGIFQVLEEQGLLLFGRTMDNDGYRKIVGQADELMRTWK